VPRHDLAPVPLADELLALGRDAGLDAVGIAPAEPFASTHSDLESRKAAGLHGGMQFTYRNTARSTDPSATVPGARALVVGARSYRRAAPVRGDAGVASGRVARYSWVDFYAPLRAALQVIADRLVDDGWVARVVADSNALVDREAAYRAGLGWYGKNANLLIPGAGSWFVLGSVVTDAPLAPADGDVRVADGCGACTRCIDACPTGAIVAPGVVDARRCLAWLVEAPGSFPVEFREALGDRIYGCDDCQEVCPPNRVLDRRSAAPDVEPGAQSEVDLVELLALDDDALLARYGRWYIAQRDPRFVRRNALVALGNVGDASSPAVVETVRRYLASDDAMLREHAVWAARRLDEQPR
jgi:epoxyqueuosine reductase